MADWFIATEGVKVVKDSASLWPQIITAVSSIGAALGGVSLTHHYTRKREDRAAAVKLANERLFIATELVFLLEKFAEECVQIATDEGYEDGQGLTRARIKKTVLSLSDVSGDWRALPLTLMYRIRELTVLQDVADRAIADAEEHDDPPDFSNTFDERQYQYAKLGLKTVIQTRRLRAFSGLPTTRLDASPWSAQPVLWGVWRKKRKQRMEKALYLTNLHKQLYEQSDKDGLRQPAPETQGLDE